MAKRLVTLALMMLVTMVAWAVEYTVATRVTETYDFKAFAQAIYNATEVAEGTDKTGFDYFIDANQSSVDLFQVQDGSNTRNMRQFDFINPSNRLGESYSLGIEMNNRFASQKDKKPSIRPNQGLIANSFPVSICNLKAGDEIYIEMSGDWSFLSTDVLTEETKPSDNIVVTKTTYKIKSDIKGTTHLDLKGAASNGSPLQVVRITTDGTETLNFSEPSNIITFNFEGYNGESLTLNTTESIKLNAHTSTSTRDFNFVTPKNNILTPYGFFMVVPKSNPSEYSFGSNNGLRITTNYFAIYNLNSGDKIKVTLNKRGDSDAVITNTFASTTNTIYRISENQLSVIDQNEMIVSGEEILVANDGYVTFGIDKDNADIVSIEIKTSKTSTSETIGSPSIDVAGDNSEKTITITPGTAGNGSIVETFYTTNGDTPNRDSYQYNAPFNLSISENTTIKAISYIKYLTNASEVATKVVEYSAPSKTAINPTVTISGWNYGETPGTPEIEGNSGNGSVTYQYKVKDSSEDFTNYPDDASSITPGTYTLKASIAETDSYQNGEATTEFTVGRGAGSIHYGTANVEKTTEDGVFINQITKVGDGTVSYSSDNTNVATIDANTGEVTIKGTGNATITATVSDGTYYDYESKTATYQITVTEASSDKYILSVTSADDSKGTVAISPEPADGKYVHGTEVTITANAEEGYEFDYWTVNNNKDTEHTTTTLTVTMTADMTIVATFKETYAITTSGLTGGTITASPNSAAEGTEVTLTIAPDNGNQLKEGTLKAYKTGDESTPVTIGEDNKFMMPAYDVTIIAEFEVIPANTHSVNLPEPATLTGGSVSAMSSVAKDETVTLNIIPDTGYEVNQVTVDGSAIEPENGTYKFTMPDKDVTVSVTFKKKDLSLTDGSGENGTLEFASNNETAGKFQVDDIITIMPNPASGYQLVANSLKAYKTEDTQTVVEIDGNNQFIMPGYDVTVTATFNNINDGDGGTKDVYDFKGWSISSDYADNLALESEKLSGSDLYILKTPTADEGSAFFDLHGAIALSKIGNLKIRKGNGFMISNNDKGTILGIINLKKDDHITIETHATTSGQSAVRLASVNAHMKNTSTKPTADKTTVWTSGDTWVMDEDGILELSLGDGGTTYIDKISVTSHETITPASITVDEENPNKVTVIPGTTDNQGGVTTYYSLDGSEPTNVLESELVQELTANAQIKTIVKNSATGKTASNYYKFIYQAPADPTTPVCYDFEAAQAKEQNLSFEENSITVSDNSGSSDSNRNDYFRLTNNSNELPFEVNNYPISWRCPNSNGGRTYPTLVEGGVQASRPFAIHNLVKGDEIIVVTTKGNLVNYTATTANVITVDDSEVAAGGTINSGVVIKIKKISPSQNYIVLNPNNAIISAIYINKTPPVKPEQPTVSWTRNEGSKAVYTITSADTNPIKYQLGSADVVASDNTSVEVSVSSNTVMKAWAYDDTNNLESGKVSVELMTTPIIEKNGVFDFTSTGLASNVTLAVDESNVALTAQGTAFYKPTLAQAATFAGKILLQNNITSNTAIRNDQLNINANQTGKVFYMALTNVSAGQYLTVNEAKGSEATSKLYIAGTDTQVTYDAPYEIKAADLTEGSLILKFDLNGGSAQVKKIIIGTGEVVTAPTITMKDATNITIAAGTSSFGKTVTTYYTVSAEGIEPTAANGTPITGASANVKMTGDCIVKAVTISETNAQSSVTTVNFVMEAEGATAVNVNELVSVIDDSNAKLASVNIGAEATTVSISGQTDNGVPVTSIADNAFTAANTANVQAIDLSETKITLSGERNEINALKNINEATLIYMPTTASVTGVNIVTQASAESDYVCNDFQLFDEKTVTIPEDKTFKATSAKLNRTFTANVKCTVCLPYKFTAEGGTFYTFTGINSEGQVEMTAQEGELAANTPYIFMPSANATSGMLSSTVTISLSDTPETPDEENNFKFVGTYERMEWDNPVGIYGFAAEAKDGASPGHFVRVGSGASIEPYRAYLVYTGSPLNGAIAKTRGASGLPEKLDVVWIPASGKGSTTGIKRVDSLNEQQENDNAPIYNLRGQRVDNSYKGIVIVNGKKMVRK